MEFIKLNNRKLNNRKETAGRKLQFAPKYTKEQINDPNITTIERLRRQRCIKIIRIN